MSDRDIGHCTAFEVLYCLVVIVVTGLYIAYRLAGNE